MNITNILCIIVCTIIWGKTCKWLMKYRGDEWLDLTIALLANVICLPIAMIIIPATGNVIRGITVVIAIMYLIMPIIAFHTFIKAYREFVKNRMR